MIWLIEAVNHSSTKEAGIYDKMKNTLMVGLMGAGLGLANPDQADATKQRGPETKSVAPAAPKAKAPVKAPATPAKTPSKAPVVNSGEPKPNEIVNVQGASKQIPLHKDAAAAYKRMLADARAQGIKAPLLLPTSGYRSSQHQKVLWEAALKRYKSPQIARKWVAPPGRSAHQSGMAIDFHLGGRNSSGNVKSLRTLPAYKWLVANAGKYGFSPYAAEPWHWVYKGK
jgi:LAS superfamily LD-carboxypeptidase LdcB